MWPGKKCKAELKLFTGKKCLQHESAWQEWILAMQHSHLVIHRMNKNAFELGERVVFLKEESILQHEGILMRHFDINRI